MDDIIELGEEKKWILVERTQDEVKYMRSLFMFVFNQFIEIFGEEIMKAESCIVFNDATKNCPKLIRACNPIHIRINAKSLEYWAQFISASNEPSGCEADIWRVPRGSNTPLLCSVASLMPRCLQRGC